MRFKKEKLSTEEAKKIDLILYLSSLGFQPAQIRNLEYWYNSPLRMEQQPSFKVTKKLNLWFDHGLGKGGTLIDFGILYHKCTVSELLQILNADFSLQQHDPIPLRKNFPPINKIVITGEYPLTTPSLLSYIKTRKIPIEIAKQYCLEIHYNLSGRFYFGIGFKNNSGGFEIRNIYFKTSSSPKDITTLKNGSNKVAVFEGFIDFLSFKTMIKNDKKTSQDFIILNSVSFFERARPIMESYSQIELYLDRDFAGINCTQRALSWSDKFIDKSLLYKNHKDINEWLMNSK
ncbi:toprim domain-containing protein [Flavobacterium sp. SE-1-e]|uniref:Toprim domain-containing protein n=2 Tax=Flavobacterium agrisoli TaxID=2793066 RepID=A0A934PPS1_9FLAO|nr:toprim domain-containing protein [Flavobacterium agrisoli]